MKRWRVGDVQRLGAGGGAGETWGIALYDCESACKKDPLFGVIGIQSGPRDRGSTLASMILGSRGWDAGRGDDCEDSPRVF